MAYSGHQKISNAKALIFQQFKNNFISYHVIDKSVKQRQTSLGLICLVNLQEMIRFLIEYLRHNDSSKIYVYLFLYFQLGVFTSTDIRQQTQINYIHNHSMREYTIIGLAIASVSILILIPNLVYSYSKSSLSLPPHTIPDALFLTSNNSLALQKKRKQLQQQFDELIKKQGGNCTTWDLQQLQNQVAACDTALKDEAKIRLNYQTKWNTTCQDWREEIKQLEDKVVELSEQKNNGIIKTQDLTEQLGQLQIELANCKAQLPCRPCQICPGCPQRETCPTCPICQDCAICENCQECQICKECPKCQDKGCGHLQDQYDLLFTKLENVKEQLKWSKADLSSCRDQLQVCQSNNNTKNCSNNNTGKPTGDCSQVQKEVILKFKESLGGLVVLVKEGKFSSVGLKQIQNLIREVESRLANSGNEKEAVGAVRLLVEGLLAEAGKAGQKNDAGILKECLEKYKAAVSQLGKCEQKLIPFIKK